MAWSATLVSEPRCSKPELTTGNRKPAARLGGASEGSWHLDSGPAGWPVPTTGRRGQRHAGLASAVSLPVGVSIGVGGRDIFLFTSPQGRYRSEGVQSRFLPGHKPRQALEPPLSFVLVTAGILGRTVSALAHQVVRGSVPCLLAVCIYSLKIYTHQLPPGLFLLSGSTLRSPLAKNNPEKEGGKRAGSRR